MSEQVAEFNDFENAVSQEFEVSQDELQLVDPFELELNDHMGVNRYRLAAEYPRTIEELGPVEVENEARKAEFIRDEAFKVLRKLGKHPMEKYVAAELNVASGENLSSANRFAKEGKQNLVR